MGTKGPPDGLLRYPLGPGCYVLPLVLLEIEYFKGADDNGFSIVCPRSVADANNILR